MSIIFSFAPFIVFFIATSFAAPLVGITAAFVVAAYSMIHNWQREKSFKILDIGSLILFCGTALFILTTSPGLNVGTASLIVNGGLLFTALISLLIGKSFTSQYAREQIAEQYWTSPIFIKTNQYITGVWIVAFAISTAATATSIFRPGVPHWIEIGGSIAGLAFALWFTKWYPARVRRANLA